MYKENLSMMYDIFDTQIALVRREREQLTEQIRDLHQRREELRTLEENLIAGLNATEMLQSYAEKEETSDE